MMHFRLSGSQSLFREQETMTGRKRNKALKRIEKEDSSSQKILAAQSVNPASSPATIFGKLDNSGRGQMYYYNLTLGACSM